MTQTSYQATPAVPCSPEVAAAMLDFVSFSHLRWLDVDSTSVARIAYDRENAILFVQMRSNLHRVYAYVGVSTEDFVALTSAKSAGAHFVKLIRNNYACVRTELAVSAVAS
jgi:hypothetical protein